MRTAYYTLRITLGTDSNGQPITATLDRKWDAGKTGEHAAEHGAAAFAKEHLPADLEAGAVQLVQTRDVVRTLEGAGA